MVTWLGTAALATGALCDPTGQPVFDVLCVGGGSLTKLIGMLGTAGLNEIEQFMLSRLHWYLLRSIHRDNQVSVFC